MVVRCGENTFIAITPSALRWDVSKPLRNLIVTRGVGIEGTEKLEEGSMITDVVLGTAEHGGSGLRTELRIGNSKDDMGS